MLTAFLMMGEPAPINYKLLHGQAVPPFYFADAVVAELVKIGFANGVSLEHRHDMPPTSDHHQLSGITHRNP